MIKKISLIFLAIFSLLVVAGCRKPGPNPEEIYCSI